MAGKSNKTDAMHTKLMMKCGLMAEAKQVILT